MRGLLMLNIRTIVYNVAGGVLFTTCVWRNASILKASGYKFHIPVKETGSGNEKYNQLPVNDKIITVQSTKNIIMTALLTSGGIKQFSEELTDQGSGSEKQFNLIQWI